MAKKKKDKKALLHVDVNITNEFNFGKNQKDKKSNEPEEIVHKSKTPKIKPYKKRGIFMSIIGITLIIMLILALAMVAKRCADFRDKTSFYNNSEIQI